MLTVGLTAYSCEAVTLHDSLESLTLGGSDYIHEAYALGEDVGYGKNVAEFQLLSEVCGKFRKLALGVDTRLLEVALESLAGVLFSGFVIGELYSGIAIILNCTELRNNARTSLDNGARYYLTVGTENGSHSDFLSN